MRVHVVTVESLGSERNVLFVPSFITTPPPMSSSAEVVLGDIGEGDLWTARLGTAGNMRTEHEAELAVDLRHAYFFDAATSESIPVAAATTVASAVAG
jgi:hypothetical protein